jgi:hypothetical protein
MRKRSSKTKSDPNELSFPMLGLLLEILDPEAAEANKIKEKSPTVTAGGLGGKEGGAVRAAKLSKKNRSKIAKKAVKA